MFLGMQFCGDDKSISTTPLDIENITMLKLTNGIYDDLFGTTNMSIPYVNSSKLWDFYTRFYAKFQNNLMAGNVNYSANTVSKIRIKRRKVNKHNWFTLFELPITNNNDFDFELIDRYAQGKQEYVYALIPMIDNVEGNINSNQMYSEFDSFYLLDKDISYRIFLNTELNININKEAKAISTLGRKYPFYISNGASDYKSGTLKFGLAPINNCELDVDAGYEYRKQFEEWINNGKPKVFKDWTGQIYMINITDVIPVTYENYDIPEYSINFVEIGNTFDETDMFSNNFIDIDWTLSSSYT